MIAALNPIAGLGHMLGHPFLRYAVIAGTAIAPATTRAGAMNFLRLRRTWASSRARRAGSPSGILPDPVPFPKIDGPT